MVKLTIRVARSIRVLRVPRDVRKGTRSWSRSLTVPKNHVVTPLKNLSKSVLKKHIDMIVDESRRRQFVRWPLESKTGKILRSSADKFARWRLERASNEFSARQRAWPGRRSARRTGKALIVDRLSASSTFFADDIKYTKVHSVRFEKTLDLRVNEALTVHQTVSRSSG